MIFAGFQRFVDPVSFSFWESLTIVLIIVIGGLGNLVGVVVGAAVLIVVPELLRGYSEYRMLLYGCALVADHPAAPARPDRPALQSRLADAQARLAMTLRFEAVTKRFGALVAIDALEPRRSGRGVITSVIGPNGAGKSTLINMCAGSYKVTSGRILLGELELQRLKKHEIAQARRRAHLSEHPAVRRHDGAAEPRGLPVPGAVRATFAEVFLPRAVAPDEGGADRALHGGARAFRPRTPRRRTGGATCSYGNQKLLEIARATMLRPKVLMLDEPAAGLNHGETDRLKEKLRELVAARSGHDRRRARHEPRDGAVRSHLRPAPGQAAVRGHARARSRPTSPCRRPILAVREKSTTSAKLLEVERIESGYGRTRILKGVDLALHEGEVVAIVGPERRRQDDPAEHDQRSHHCPWRRDPLRRRGDHRHSRLPHRAPRHRALPGRAAHLPAADAWRRISSPASSPATDGAMPSCATRRSRCSRSWPSAAPRSPAACPAGSSRCSPSPAA